LDQAIPLLLNILTLTSILMLVGLGLAIIFGLMNVINMAHGEFVTIGAFTLSALQGIGGSYWLALLVAPLIGGAFGFLLERGIVRHLYARPLDTILATWGISLILQQVLQLLFGSGPQEVFTPIHGTISILGSSYPAYRLVLIAFAKPHSSYSCPASLSVSIHVPLVPNDLGRCPRATGLRWLRSRDGDTG